MDYDTLKTDIANLLNRGDLTAEIPGFIRLCEAMIQRDLRSWRMENRSTLNTVDQYPGLPSDWLETMRLTNSETDMPLELISRQAMSDMRTEARFAGRDATGPQYYRHSQNGFELFPSPGDSGITLELEYYSKVPALGVDDGNGVRVTNWVLDNHPDIYLYGSAIHSAPFLADDGRIATWGSLYNSAAMGANKADQAAEMSASSPRMRKTGMAQSYVPRR